MAGALPAVSTGTFFCWAVTPVTAAVTGVNEYRKEPPGPEGTGRATDSGRAADSSVRLSRAWVHRPDGDRASLGAGEVIACDMREIVDFATEWLDYNRGTRV